MPKIPLDAPPIDPAAADALAKLKTAEELAIDIARRGHPLHEIRDAYFCLAMARAAAERERARAGRLAAVLMALVNRAGGKLSILDEEINETAGTLIESELLDGPGLTFEVIATPAAGRLFS